MKKLLFILIPLILIVGIAGSTLLPQNLMQKLSTNKETLISKNQNNNNSQISSEHLNQKITCKTCHAKEYPTKNDLGLRICPRDNMITEFPSPEKGPEIVKIDEMSENYTGVIFSHRIHSKMSEMSIGCADCHHYNTSGPVLNCRECHEQNRDREDVSVPDLKAAFHRQCLTCHKEWSHDNGCSTQCHLRKELENQNISQQKIIGKTHPKLSEPNKLTWNTNSGAGKIVTFFHNEHIQIFKINCNTCHNQENCIICHDVNNKQDFNKSIEIKKSAEEHHKPCINCHYENNCQKCHRENEMTPFNHGKSSGWTLKNYHSRLACTKCHGNSMPFKKLDNNCTSCHKDFITGKFNHKLAGLTLSKNHADMECENCHLNKDFSKEPKCSVCHDDKSYPSQLPGNR